MSKKKLYTEINERIYVVKGIHQNIFQMVSCNEVKVAASMARLKSIATFLLTCLFN